MTLIERKLLELKSTAINRLSIGVQSFFDADLRFMNRAHTAEEASASIKNAQDNGFQRTKHRLDLRCPTSTDAMWQENLSQFFDLNIPHLSAYSLTIEEKTALANQQQKGKLQLDEEQNYRHYSILQSVIKERGYEQYDFLTIAGTNSILSITQPIGKEKST